MKSIDSIKTAIRGLGHAKMRSFLTMLGIVIGISSVIFLMSIGNSVQKLILDQVQGIGSNLIFVMPGATKGSKFASPASVRGIIIKTLVKKDMDALKKEQSIDKIASVVRGISRVIYENTDTSITYEGATEDYFTVRNMNTTKGFAFTKSDVDSMNRVAVIGSELAKTLFGDREPVGKTVRLKDMNFRIIGVLDKKGMGPMGVDQDNIVIIPMSVAQKQLLGIDYYSFLVAQANDTYAISFITGRMASILRQNHRIIDPDKDDFTVHTQEDALSLLGNITSILQVFLTSIAAISLIVGGIGIMNIMFVSVVERTREIGLRKAVGATNIDILQQFLWEAVILTFIGGIVGILIGAFFTFSAYLIFTQVLAIDWSFSMPLSAIGLALFVSTFTGLIFGIYPARKASLKSPIEALRYE